MSKKIIEKAKKFIKKHPVLCGVGFSAIVGTAAYMIGSKNGYSAGEHAANTKIQNILNNGYQDTVLFDEWETSRFAKNPTAGNLLLDGAAMMNLKPGESVFVWRRPVSDGPDLYVNTCIKDVEKVFGKWFDGCLRNYVENHKEVS